jgi:thiol:disulfide interchange protein
LGRWVYLLTGLLCVALAIFTFRDFFRARQGRATEMALKLPMSLRQRINKVIRENVQVRAFAAMAFVTGFVVSLIELACTGQVYYPTIVYMTSVPEFAERAFLYLALYCLMFVLPLIVVFLLSYLGTTLDTLRLFIGRYTATVKAITALLFVGLSLWMTWTIAHQFGVLMPWNWILMGITVLVIAVGVVVRQVLERSASRQSSPRPRKRRRPARR